MATFVQLSEEDPALDLVVLLESIGQGKQESKDPEDTPWGRLVLAKEYGSFLEQAVFTQFDKILAEPEPRIFTVFSLSFSLLKSLPPAELQASVDRLVNALVQQPKQSGLLKLRLLSTLSICSAMWGEITNTMYFLRLRVCHVRLVMNQLCMGNSVASRNGVSNGAFHSNKWDSCTFWLVVYMPRIQL